VEWHEAIGISPQVKLKCSITVLSYRKKASTLWRVGKRIRLWEKLPRLLSFFHLSKAALPK
jgi:hypothetical protein